MIQLKWRRHTRVTAVNDLVVRAVPDPGLAEMNDHFWLEPGIQNHFGAELGDDE